MVNSADINKWINESLVPNVRQSISMESISMKNRVEPVYIDIKKELLLRKAKDEAKQTGFFRNLFRMG